MEFSDIIGETFSKIERTHDEILFHSVDGAIYKMYHSQSCCESVTVDDITGDLDDLVGSPILSASEDSNSDKPNDIARDYEPESETWTFYNLATKKGYVAIRWRGSSNGYYSESVNFEKIESGGFIKEPFLPGK